MHHMTTAFGNASSADHAFGDEAQEAVDSARREVARLVGSSRRSVVFTSGATESLNLALQGLARTRRPTAGPLRIALPRTEHKAVLDTCDTLARAGLAELIWLKVDELGHVRLEELDAACRSGVDVICVMAANNEIGTVAPMLEIGRIAAAHGTTVVCDATQAAGKIPMQRDAWNLTYVALSAHKFYGPKGVGALVLPPDTMIEPLLHGGGHERGLRSGTLNVPGIAGIGAAARLRIAEMDEDERRIAQLRDRLQGHLLSGLPELVVNGDVQNRLAGNLHVSIPDVPNTAVIARVREDLAISTGAACSSGAIAPSHVLQAIGLPESLVDGGLRFGLGKFTTEQDVDAAAELVIGAATAARAVLQRAG
jgi:cysteine desulfurase